MCFPIMFQEQCHTNYPSRPSLIATRRVCPLGRVLAKSNIHESSNTHAPQRLTGRPDANITQLGILPAFRALICVAKYCPNFPLLLLADNAAVASWVIGGTGEPTLAWEIVTI